MGNMRFKVGDRVRIKSLDWYNKNKDEVGVVLVENGDYMFCKSDTEWCGKIVTIKEVCLNEYYKIVEDFGKYKWTDGMIEGLVEEETLIERVDDNGLPFNEWLSHKGAFHIPDGYELKDENGNVINAMKIILEKKKKEYPKTYNECAEIITEFTGSDCNLKGCIGYMSVQLTVLQKLLICRDAYWKIAGEEMGLGKPWEPDWKNHDIKYILFNQEGELDSINVSGPRNYILAFPTAEMRDAFYENFKELIKMCKELL